MTLLFSILLHCIFSILFYFSTFHPLASPAYLSKPIFIRFDAWLISIILANSFWCWLKKLFNTAKQEFHVLTHVIMLHLHSAYTHLLMLLKL